ncbi:MAG: proline iminopeptidase-family hydrolase [Bacillales bacterium]
MIEGTITNHNYKTYYQIYGENNTTYDPIIILHGGPGGTLFPYIEFSKKLVEKGHQVILYNQHGSSKSDILKPSKDLFTFESFEEELRLIIDKLNIKKYHLLGHSWGGMLALHYILNNRDTSISSIILFSTLPSTKLWNEEAIRMINNNFSNKYQEAIFNQINNLEYNKATFIKAMKKYYKEHVRKPLNKEEKKKTIKNPFKNCKESYEYMWGKTEFCGNGTLKDYNLIDELYKIENKTLILSGAMDESTPYINKLMNDKIRNSKWHLFQHSRHCAYNEEQENVVNILDKWINDINKK